MKTPEELDLCDTDDLIDALRRRSKTLFIAMRPLADHKDYTALIASGVNGKKVVTWDDRDRCIGLAFQAMQYDIPKAVEDPQ